LLLARAFAKFLKLLKDQESANYRCNKSFVAGHKSFDKTTVWHATLEA